MKGRGLDKINFKKRKRNKNKTNVTQRQHDIHLEDTSARHLWLMNYGERTSPSTLI